VSRLIEHPSQVPDDIRAADTLRLAPCTQLLDPTTICLWRDDADRVRDFMIELLTDGQQPGTVLGARDDPIPAQLAAEDFDLGFQKPDARDPASGAGYNEEVQGGVEPVQHGLRILKQQAF